MELDLEPLWLFQGDRIFHRILAQLYIYNFGYFDIFIDPRAAMILSC